MNQDLLTLGQHPSKSIAERLSKQPGMIDLTNGQPDIPVPAKLHDEMIELLRADERTGSQFCNHYAPSRGDEKLRDAIAQYYEDEYAARVDPSQQVLVTNGAAEALWLAIMTLTNAGDDIVLFEPSYSLYDRIAHAMGRRPVWVRGADPLIGAIDFSALQSNLSKRTGAIIVNSPVNPSGAVVPPQDLVKLAEIAQRHGCYLIFDEVFDATIFEGVHQCLVEHRHVCTVNSFSKRLNMMGWRLGWLCADRNIVEQASKLHALTCLACPTASQRAAANLLSRSGAARDHMDKIRRHVEHKAHSAYEAVQAVPGLNPGIRPPQAGFYLFVECRVLADELQYRYGGNCQPDEIVSAHFERACRVAVVPGRAFGPRSDAHIRMSFASDEHLVEEACERLRASL